MAVFLGRRPKKGGGRAALTRDQTRDLDHAKYTNVMVDLLDKGTYLIYPVITVTNFWVGSCRPSDLALVSEVIDSQTSL